MLDHHSSVTPGGSPAGALSTSASKEMRSSGRKELPSFGARILTSGPTRSQYWMRQPSSLPAEKGADRECVQVAPPGPPEDERPPYDLLPPAGGPQSDNLQGLALGSHEVDEEAYHTQVVQERADLRADALGGCGSRCDQKGDGSADVGSDKEQRHHDKLDPDPLRRWPLSFIRRRHRVSTILPSRTSRVFAFSRNSARGPLFR